MWAVGSAAFSPIHSSMSVRSVRAHWTVTAKQVSAPLASRWSCESSWSARSSSSQQLSEEFLSAWQLRAEGVDLNSTNRLLDDSLHSKGASALCSEDRQVVRQLRLGLFSVRFDRPLSVCLTRPSGQVSMQKRGMNHSQWGDVIQGATRLVCGKQIVESSAGKHKNTLLSFIDPKKQGALAAYLDSEQLMGSDHEFVAVLPLVGDLANKPLFHSCSLRFLPPKEQLRNQDHQWTLCDETGRVFTGSVSLSFDEHDTPMMAAWNQGQARIGMRSELLRDVWSHLITKSSHDAATVDHLLVGGIVPSSLEQLSDADAQRAAVRLRSPWNDPDLLSMIESEASLEVGISGILRGIESAVVKPLADLMADTVSATIGDPVNSNVLPAIASKVSDILGDTIGPAMVNPIVADLVPALTETVTDYMTNDMQAEMQRLVTPDVVPQITNRVTTEISDEVTRRVANRFEPMGSQHLANRISHDFGILGTNMLSAILTSALTQAFSHSPMQDYYCYYCSEFKMYCSYCQVAPTRLYYSVYYANYYSTYYSHYFTSYFSEPGHPTWIGDKYPSGAFSPGKTEMPTDQGSSDEGRPAHMGGF